MELIDINAYVGHWPFKQLKYNTCGTLLDRMNRFGVDVSVISNLNGIFYKNTQSANQELYDELNTDRRFKDRFLPFAIINPIYAGWRDDLEICVTKLGMKGLRLYPQYHDYEITHPSLIELVTLARDRGLPVAFDIRMVDSRQRSWMDIPHFEVNAPEKYDTITREWSLQNIIPIMRAVPDAKYMILNLANSIRLDDSDMDLLKKADVLFDTSGRVIRGADTLGELLKRFGTDKFAFGTHSPILDYLSGRLRIESLSEVEADEPTKEMLRSGNAKRILKL
ncbi:MAG TPA: amidohydrolase family protein [Cyclobacteriaceae bacterium]|nr:amidohydrolase family protein [Cyclobacteriaceae bacterium]